MLYKSNAIRIEFKVTKCQFVTNSQRIDMQSYTWLPGHMVLRTNLHNVPIREHCQAPTLSVYPTYCQIKMLAEEYEVREC